MRIIAGQAKGHRINCLQGSSIRPTQDRVREAIFSSLSVKVVGARVLDLFAGTGALGLEALSRGAQQAVFVDKDPQTIRLIKENSQHCKLDQNTTIIQKDVFEYLNSQQGQYDLIFADPPYYKGYYDQLLLVIDQKQLLSPEGTLVIEIPRELALPAPIGSLTCQKTRKYGITTIGYYEYKN